MSNDTNVSEMLLRVGGDFLESMTSRGELQARVDIVRTAWNIALLPLKDRKNALKACLQKYKKIAPSKEALKGLESEINELIIQKDLLYPDVSSEIVNTDVSEKGQHDYVIKAYFKKSDETKH
ncbi:MAG: hypothetical protein L3J28_14190 [Candidatus Polarisedimenticolaceae bacterium]|nr:hypothetical protein [Candidatus Polarisedimenticolaceae bacterium]